MSQRARRGFARQRLVAVGEYFSNLAQLRLGSQVPELVELLQKQRQIVGGKRRGRRRIGRIPVFRLGRSRDTSVDNAITANCVARNGVLKPW